MLRGKLRGAFAAAAATVSLLALTAPPASGATEVIRSHFKGQQATAVYSTSDECGFKDVDATAVDGQAQTTGKPTTATTVDVFLFVVDFCTGEEIFAFGSATPSELTISKKLGTASATANVEVVDVFTGETFEVDVDLTWTGVGPVERQKLNIRETFNGFTFREHFDGRFRDALATGTITVDGTTFASGQASFAFLASVKDAVAFIERT